MTRLAEAVWTHGKPALHFKDPELSVSPAIVLNLARFIDGQTLDEDGLAYAARLWGKVAEASERRLGDRRTGRGPDSPVAGL
jgi:ribonucleoside-diphosphate reductase alpha chain